METLHTIFLKRFQHAIITIHLNSNTIFDNYRVINSRQLE